MTVTISGSAGITTNSGAVYDGLQSISKTASGTEVNFTSIPAWVKRIKVHLLCSTLGTSGLKIQIGPNSGVVTSGYTGAVDLLGSSVAPHAMSTGFDLEDTTATANNWRAYTATITKVGTSNTYHFTVIGGASGTANVITLGGGFITLGNGNPCEFVKVTTQNGTDAFGGGSITLFYE